MALRTGPSTGNGHNGSGGGDDNSGAEMVDQTFDNGNEFRYVLGARGFGTGADNISSRKYQTLTGAKGIRRWIARRVGIDLDMPIADSPSVRTALEARRDIASVLESVIGGHSHDPRAH